MVSLDWILTMSYINNLPFTSRNSGFILCLLLFYHAFIWVIHSKLTQIIRERFLEYKAIKYRCNSLEIIECMSCHLSTEPQMEPEIHEHVCSLCLAPKMSKKIPCPSSCLPPRFALSSITSRL
jgi:hypothetical protein